MPNTQLILCTLVVPDYDDAIRYFREVLGFTLREDTPLASGKRWVVVAPQSDEGAGLLLARANNDEQQAQIGNQAGGRVAFFLATDEFDRTWHDYQKKGVQFLEEPRNESYGRVAVFEDVFGNRWDLIQYSATND